MAESNTVTLVVSIFGVAGTIAGTAVGAYASLKSQSMQTEREEVAACIASIDKKDELLRSKAEAFLAAMSDEISFFREHNEFEVRLAKEKIAPLQKAAFSLSAYATPNLALKSLNVVAASDAALAPENAAQFQAVVQGLIKASSEWHPAFREESAELKHQRDLCKKSS